MSKELTDDFLNKKLQAGSFYFVETENGHFEPMVVDMDGDFNDYEGNYYKPEFSKGKLEVLSPCDYNTLVHLETKAEWQAERIKELEKEIEFKQRYINLRTGPVYREEIYRLQKASIDELTSLLKDCKLSIIKIYDRLRFSDENEITPADLINGIDDIKPMLYNIVTRLNAEIGESEEK